jgi:murein DD-endopeptidase MepM/ murein hydrolase activator NlpD
MRRLLVAILISVATLARAGDSHTDCTANWICISAVPADGDIELHARNLSDVPLTFTLKVRTRYLKSSGPHNITESLSALESRRVMVMSQVDGNKKGKYRFDYEWTIGNKDAVHDDDQVYRLPYATGKVYRVLQGFGSRFSHTGIEQYAVDFKMTEGTAVHAARAGLVARTEERHSVGCWDGGCGGYANYIIILHDDDTTGEYYHLQTDGVLVEVGERVEAGQKIGLSGNTGNSALPHLHFGVYRAIERGREQSIPFRFLSADGIVARPRRGGLYQATPVIGKNRRAAVDGANRSTFDN